MICRRPCSVFLYAVVRMLFGFCLDVNGLKEKNGMLFLQHNLSCTALKMEQMEDEGELKSKSISCRTVQHIYRT
jgi:hypothetical protein